MQTLPDSDVSTHTHVHTFIASVVIGSPSTARIHHHDLAESINVDDGARLLRLVEGVEEVGRLDLPATGGEEAHDMISQLASNMNNGVKTAADIRVAVLNMPGTRTFPNACTVEVFTIPVFGASPDALLEDRLTPIWKWSKSNSVYFPKSGFWEADLKAALDDGEWNAGRDLRLLLRGATEYEVKMIRESETRFKIMPRANDAR
ncbi:hypothetical protein PFICI_00094 [Pestalotiopsis fici W106-1]|uniref:Uncharacterized protein n=1 Tax=Pestalotiopsis fici (strain W106-1 / CGMCC3.15140) TaxID=1229662 RepID=W3XLZ2_PESFW|nr:uncharacterized protein PFICI_00094 [Pestalotiopsis fici W106-1]ETS86266.1 hypothetical protein PFICI_00094 [Pestalotiopsis fici W106-1]